MSFERTKLDEIGSGAFQDTDVSFHRVECRVIPENAFSGTTVKGYIVYIDGDGAHGDRKFVITATKIENNAFKGMFFSNRGKLAINTTITKGCISIGDNAFDSLGKWRTDPDKVQLSMCDTIETLGKGAFQNNNFISIHLSEGLITVGEEAFANCTFRNDSLTLPGKVTTIGARAFANCNLREITVPASVKEIGSAFADKDKVTLIVTEGSYAELWAQENGYGYRYEGGADDLSWLDG